jgi:tetratricopeptide (TPR) repeat protein
MPLMNNYKKIFKSTFAKVISIVLIISFCLSGFLFYDYYKRQGNKIKGYYWVYKGDKALKKEQLQEAIYCYEKAIKLHPTHYRAMYNLANIYVVYEDYYSALKNYEKALSVKPDYEIARIDYAIILGQVYRVDDAIEQYKKVLEFQPKFIKIPFLVDNKKSYFHNRGVAYYNMGLAYRTKSLMAGIDKQTSREFLIRAAKNYEQAADILNSYNTNYNLGLINQLLKNANQAAYYYCKAIELAPMEYEAHFNYAVLLNELKDYGAAQEEFQKAGLVLDSKGEGTKTRYIYYILNDVNQKAVLYPDEETHDMPEQVYEYKAGKLVTEPKIKDQKEDELYKFYSRCAKYDIYYGKKNKE